MPSKPGRKLDRSQTNRRQKHELDHRAAKWRVSKLAVILADLLQANSLIDAESWITHAKHQLRRANREAREARRARGKR